MSIELRKAVRAITDIHDRHIRAFNKEFEEELNKLQNKCSHDFTKWNYRLDEYNEIGSNSEGVLFKYRDCLFCGLIEKQLDETNDYESEILW